MKRIILTAAVVITVMNGTAMIHATAFAKTRPGHINNGKLNHQVGVGRRMKDEEDKINDGVRDHQLSPQEAAGMQQRLNYTRTQMDMYKSQHGGHMSGEETRKLEAVENHDSGALVHERRTSHQP